jgi:hypothetical protein
MENDLRLLPCPFCGENPTMTLDGGPYLVECPSCRAASGTAPYPAKAAKFWNRRSRPEDQGEVTWDGVSPWKGQTSVAVERLWEAQGEIASLEAKLRSQEGPDPTKAYAHHFTTPDLGRVRVYLHIDDVKAKVTGDRIRELLRWAGKDAGIGRDPEAGASQEGGGGHG